MVERSSPIEQIDKSFNLSDEVSVSMKPRGFNAWCTLPYYKHPQGCPNFGVKEKCPPNAPYFLDVFEEKVLLAYIKFDFESYLGLRKSFHPDWNERELRNPRHFQGHLDSLLKKGIGDVGDAVGGRVAVFSPEAMLVNMHLTCRAAGIELEWPPEKVMYRVAILGIPKYFHTGPS